MTGIGGLVFGPPPAVGTKWARLLRILRRFFHRQRLWIFGHRLDHKRFVVLCFRRTGSNWLCGMLFNHEEILMHNEIFNENGVHTYYKADVLANNWDYEGRDVNPAGFLDFCYSPSKFSKFRPDGSDKQTPPPLCKAVAYKSFPNHYLQKGSPLMPLYNIFQEKVLCDVDVCKIILMRRDVIRTYISSRRAFETGHYMTKTYQNYKIHVDLVDFQRFVDRYFQCYREYQQKTQGHARVLVAYEDLCQDPARAMAPVWNLLGVSCPDGNNPLSLKECVPQSAGPLAPLRSSIVNYDELEFACRHDPSLNSFRDLPMDSPLLVEDNSWDKIQRPSSASGDESEVRPSTEADSSHHHWALLIPIRASPADTFDTCRERVKRMYDAIVDTEVSHENFPVLIFGVDDDDPIYTDGKLLQEVCSDNEVVVQVYADLQGRICRIWKRLATIAYDDYEVDFTLLLGDDVVLLDKGWRLSIEKQFASIARNRKLPFGAACVALYDESFPGFPTFPVVHRWHYETFDRVLLPSTFDNQGGDPFLFELYKRFGASQFALDCKLRNTIGGKHQARYTKQRLRFEDDILTTSLNTLRMALPDHTIMVCIDVVVPCYRCDMAILEKILALRASWPVQVNFWIVLDNPDHEESDKGSPRNYGASAARNFGLGHSKADYCVLIDDDCIPSGQLLDAYVGAILRNPKASVFVGLTHFPAPHNLLTHAIVASDIPGAYSIAERTREPPWGVTANLCVKARQSRIRFDLSFPRTGGGEDLDYCARARHHGSIMSVPGAVAHHPWWSNGEFKAVWHIFAWAEGEVQCVGKKHMRDHIFWTFPNGVETLVVGMLTTLMLRYEFGGTVQVLSVKFALWFITVCLCEIAWQASRIGSHRLRDPVKESVMKGVLVRCFAALLIMSQDFFRLLQALDHSPFWLFWRVDWHFGQMPHLISARKRNNAFRFGFYLSLLLFLNFSNLNRSYENA